MTVGGWQIQWLFSFDILSSWVQLGRLMVIYSFVSTNIPMTQSRKELNIVWELHKEYPVRPDIYCSTLLNKLHSWISWKRRNGKTILTNHLWEGVNRVLLRSCYMWSRYQYPTEILVCLPLWRTVCIFMETATHVYPCKLYVSACLYTCNMYNVDITIYYLCSAASSGFHVSTWWFMLVRQSSEWIPVTLEKKAG